MSTSGVAGVLHVAATRRVASSARASATLMMRPFRHCARAMLVEHSPLRAPPLLHSSTTESAPGLAIEGSRPFFTAHRDGPEEVSAGASPEKSGSSLQAACDVSPWDGSRNAVSCRKRQLSTLAIHSTRRVAGVGSCRGERRTLAT